MQEQAREIQTFIDGAAILGVLESLSSHNGGDVSAWAFRSAVEVTTLLVQVPNVMLSPIPEMYNSAIGPYGIVLQELSELVRQEQVPSAIRSRALGITKQWANRNIPRLRENLITLHNDPNYHSWIDWLSRNQWPDHARRHGGLYEEAFIGPLSRVLDIPISDLLSLRASSVTNSQLDNLVRHPDQEVSQVARDAFTLSTLLRGRYYETMSSRTNNHVVHHPIRDHVLAKLPESRQTEVILSNTEWFLSIIIISCMYNFRVRDRHQEWVRAIRKARALALSGLIDVGEKETDEAALRVAARDAMAIGLRTHPPWVDHVLNIGTATGLGALASYHLNGFESLGLSLVTETVFETLSPVSKAAKKFSGREQRLENLGRLNAGRLAARWKRG